MEAKGQGLSTQRRPITPRHPGLDPGGSDVGAVDHARLGIAGCGWSLPPPDAASNLTSGDDAMNASRLSGGVK